MSSSRNKCPHWDLKTFNEILALSSTPDKNARIALINSIPDQKLICLVELVYNVLKGKVQISQKNVRRLQRYSQDLRRLSTLRNIDETREFLVQTGGTPIAILLPVLISAASSILEHVLQ
ncbi:hypothetical protein GCK72_003102 [Caenorhabditis remanei]|uniref:Uncharacterized protein n=1 Tax=Caenorhabditis remanei TaxID=31234 RepID=A0A6A5HWK4_CAERE|nr:hypothetical protein GCK72_003102 [Caenorhabditis remanei]KAF1771276.1 hypothetical protein GCK72_003102 [Caenorhabditis remanei]